MIERILEIINSKNMTPARFAEETGVQRSSISHLISGRNKPSLEFIQKVLSTFPDISTEWLMTGNGNMYKSKPTDGPKADPEVSSIIKEIENEDVTSRDNIVTKVSTGMIPDVTESNPTENKKSPVRKTTAGDNQVEKIVWFFKNKTFREYYPGE